MKRSKSIGIITFFLLCMSVVAVRKAYALVTNTVLCRIYLDHALSEEEQQRITAELESFHHQNPEQLFAAIKEEFQEVQTVQERYRPEGVREITITVDNPLLRINEDLILTEGGLLVPKNIYEESCLQSCAQIKVPEVAQQNVMQILANAQNLARLSKQFNIIWKEPSCIYLHDKERDDLFICTEHDHMPNDQCITQCEQVYEQVKQQMPASKVIKKIVTDMRFQGQIIAYFLEKGV